MYTGDRVWWQGGTVPHKVNAPPTLDRPMTTPPRLIPLLRQFDFARGQLADRMGGLTYYEYLWEPVPNCWTIRPRAGEPALAFRDSL